MKISFKYLLFSTLILWMLGMGMVSRKNSEPILEVKQMYILNLRAFEVEATKLHHQAMELSNVADYQSKLAEQLAETRFAYKKVEFILEYIFPDHAKYQFNGAPLPKVIADSLVARRPEVVDPHGLQMLEELIYANPLDIGEIRKLTEILKTDAEAFAQYQENNMERVSSRRFFEACRFSLLRISFLGLTGFDTPQSDHAIEEARISWRILRESLEIWEDVFEEESQSEGYQLFALMDKGSLFLDNSNSISDFNHASWTRDIIQPLYEIMLDLQLNIGLPTIYDEDPKVDKWEYPVNYLGRQIFDDSFFDKAGFIGHYHKSDEPSRIELGRLLFFDPILSSNNNRSCASCHDPQKGFGDGFPKSPGQNPNTYTQRNSMGLVNSVFSHSFFYDFRVKNLEDQIDHVVFNPLEFSTDYKEIVKKVFLIPEYKDLFGDAFPEMYDQQAESGYILKMALASYVASLTSFNSPFDKYMRSEINEQQIDSSVLKGYNLFMGKAGCGTCHFAPSFGGIVPPQYKESESEVLGVPASSATNVLDADSGRYQSGWPWDNDPWFLHHFKTPGIRNVALTAPYMHNGIYDSLEEVMDFYNVGGGLGMGLQVDNQTLPGDSLHLSQAEMQAIISFMEALTDTSGLTAVPSRLPSILEKSEAGHIKVYPNPYGSKINVEIKTDRKKSVEIKLFDIRGRLLAEPNTKILHPGKNVIKVEMQKYHETIFMMIELDGKAIYRTLVNL